MTPPAGEETQVPEDAAEDIQNEESSTGPQTSIGTMVAIAAAGIFLLFLASAIIMREVNIRRRRRRRFVSHGRGKHAK